MNDKDLLRKQLKLKRSAFQGEQRERADKAILEYFKMFSGGNDSFFIYNSFSDEASTKLIIGDLLKEGKKVYIPRVEGENMVAVPYGKMRNGAFGIEEPEGQAYYGDIDVTVVPLLVINKRGYRIGYGKGYYDRFLRDRQTKKIGIFYSFQLTDFMQDEWDIPLDYFICEEGIYLRE